MRRPTGRSAHFFAVFTLATAFAGATCGVRDAVLPPEEVPSEAAAVLDPAARARLAELRAAFPSIEDSAASGFRRAGDLLSPIRRLDLELPPIPGGRHPALDVVLAGRAGEKTRIADERTGLAFSFSLEGGSRERAEEIDGFLVAERALRDVPGARLVTRPLAFGVEDYVHLPQRPREERLRWDLHLENVAHLRLVSDVLELVHSDGRPVMRMRPPWVEGSDGARHAAKVTVEGCTVDTDPSPPWRRALPSPGADRCSIAIDWSGADVAYPALVDPEWIATGLGMTVGRLGHTATSIDATGDVLIAGGFDPASGVALSSTEFYSFCSDPCQPTFAVGPTLSESRGAHTETYLPGSGKVLLVGGRSLRGGGAVRTTADLVTCVGQVCSVAQISGAGSRYQHTATKFETNDDVLIAGGSGTNPSSAVIFSSQNSSFGSLINLTTRREAHAAELILDGSNRVLVAGGVGPSFVLSTAEIFTPGSPGSFLAIAGSTMTSPRAYASAARLEDGNKRILIAGGTNSATLTVGSIFSKTADVYDPVLNVFLQQPKQMVTPRAGHTTTKLVGQGKVLLAGGINNPDPVAEPDNITGATKTTEFYAVNQSNFDLDNTNMLAWRSEHAAVRLTTGSVLVTGGIGKQVNSTTAASAELLLRSAGEQCTVGGECATGFCTTQEQNPICCNEPCSGLCRTCNASGGFPDGTCHDEVAGETVSSLCAVIGDQEASIVLECDGAGGVNAATSDPCEAYKCETDPNSMNKNKCKFGCSTDLDCVAIGYCDTAIGECKFQKKKGETCTATTPCLGGLPCVDGYCCGTACPNECEACDVLGSEGDCTQVVDEQPHNKPACIGDGTVCGGVCKDDTTCTYPTDTCGALSCVAGTSTASKCDTGVCTETISDCAPFVCQNSSACANTCQTSDDCVAEHVCVSGDCKEVISALCDPETNEIVSPGGATVSCAPYRCSVSTNACLSTCESIDQCSDGFVCDPGGTCIEPPPAPAAPTGCSVPAGGGSSSVWPLSALALALVRRRRRAAAGGAR